MGESELTQDFRSESELVDFAAELGKRIEGCRPLLIGLRGDLGAGKTTLVRALLRGLGYPGRVPSPTYTLLEEYTLSGLDVIHLDLYRLAHEQELENLGVRDWLARPDTWVIVEWPERAPRLEARCDLVLTLTDRGGSERSLALTARTRAGIRALQAARQRDSKYRS
jgi:tRNA threonylcarbamoyladenosine biosynthesis protein TsaE